VEQQDIPPSRGNPQLLLIGGGAALFVVLLALAIALAMIFALRDDVATLEDQVRRSTKTAKAMQEELASLKEQAAAVAASRRSEPQPQPQNIDAADTSADCIIRPGSKLPDCMKLGPK
jgi:hypothetical protein